MNRPGSPRRSPLFAICAVAMAMPTQVMAFTTEGVSWQNGVATFNSVLASGTAVESADLSSAIGDWNNASAFRYSDTGQSADPCNGNGPNGADIATTNCGDSFGSGVLAVTTYETSGTGSFLTHAGIVFNRNISFGSYDGPLQSNLIDFRRVALHELGHVLGMDHENDPSIPAIMSPSVGNIDRLTADDIAGVESIYGVASGGSETMIASAILPASRSVQVGTSATAFVTIVNYGSQPASACSIALGSPIAANFSYQTTSPTTNQPIGSPNMPADIAAGGSQSFVIALTPTAMFNATDVVFTMKCANTPTAASTVGLNTLLLSASNIVTPDVVALAATVHNDGYVGVMTGSGAFAVATVNLGSSGNLVASADTGSTTLPVSITLCQTDPASGQCITPIQSSLTTSIAANATPTFGIFVTATASISPDPANKRIFVRFRDATGTATRGSTSVAVTSGE
jgi:hypothetical protein